MVRKVQESKKWRPIFEAGVWLSDSQYTSVLMSAMAGAGDSSANFTAAAASSAAALLMAAAASSVRMPSAISLRRKTLMGSWFCL